MKPIKKLLLTTSLTVLFLFCIYCFCQSSTWSFRAFSKELLHNELCGNTINLHYTLAYPEDYNIRQDPVLPNEMPACGNKEQILSYIQTLKKISPAQLSEQDAYSYRLMLQYLAKSYEGCSYPYYFEPLSPSSGMLAGLPVLLADYTFRNVQDIEDYLSLLDQTDTYFDSLIRYEQEKAAAGLFMSDSSAQKVIRQCSEVMDQKQLKEGTHFLHLTFEERLQPLVKTEQLTQEEMQQYLSDNDRLLTTVMAPSYERVADAFTLLLDSGKNNMGLCYYPKGKDYYTYLIAYNTGSSRSIEEVRSMLEQDFQTNVNALQRLLLQNPSLLTTNAAFHFDRWPSIQNNPDQLLTISRDMLSSLQNRMEKDFPCPSRVPHTVTIKKVSASMEKNSSPAYYLTPPIDDMSNHTIYVNRSGIQDNLTLYTTLAHEGYPGHLYQTLYSQNTFLEENASYIRYLLHYGGYVEGWAYYVENLSYEYAKEIAPADRTTNAGIEAQRISRNLHLCLYSYLDIAIHYDGITKKQMDALLIKLGLGSQISTDALYEYLVEEPANYLKYYLGYLEMLELKKEAHHIWGSSYSDYAFHKKILETGPSDFDSLRYALSSSAMDSR